MARISIFLTVVALIAGLVGCAQPAQYSLTISTTAGGEITAPGDGTFSYEEGTEVPLVAFPHTGYRFVSWSGDVDTVDDVNAASTTVSMNGDYSITANFIKQYHLTVSSTAGGSVTMPGEGIYAYDEGDVANLVAQAEEGYHFASWIGDVGTIADTNAAVTSITINSNCIITANFAVDLYFRVDVSCVLHGPATLPPQQRNPSILLQVMTNIVVDSVQVDLADGRSVTMAEGTDAYTPEVDWTTLFRFGGGELGMPVAGGEYVFTGLDAIGEPISGAVGTDIWVGIEPPDPPTNVRAELTGDGILISWDESPVVPGSFEPVAGEQLGFYQVDLDRVETGELVYGANLISVSSHLIPRYKEDFTGRDHGLSLGEIEDGTYHVRISSHGMVPESSLGKGHEYTCFDPSQTIILTIQDGEITIE